jgi:hypothetical protein
MTKDKFKTMTLKKNFFENIIINKVFYNNDNDMLSVVCEKIADDYAMLFAEWLVDYFDEDESCKDWDKCTKQLLQIYKKEKGL